MRAFFELFSIFLKLGLTSFGGPVAHLGYFRTEFVDRRKWFDDAQYADLVALCQFLPGPASSQVGFAIGVQRGGILGGIAAFLGFTLPSILILLGFAAVIPLLQGDLGQGLIRGLKLIAVAIVAHAVLGMAQSLANTTYRALIAVGALILCLLLTGFVGQILAIILGAIIGYLILEAPSAQAQSNEQATRFAWSHGTAIASFFILLIALPLLAASTNQTSFALADIFYRAGALVFGGGHVVLPLLQAEMVPNLMDQNLFLAGYGATQALPGPIFSFASYLGAMASDTPLTGVLIGATAIFIPGFLLTYGALPIWQGLRTNQIARKALLGTNAAVVGLLAAALINPIAMQALNQPLDWTIALIGFAILWRLKWPAWILVLAGGAAGALFALIGLY
ncbi:putative chromate transport protein [Maritalea myrionectae]|uniref:Putative chromate transport protein n=1 Tax=Maritalea myrionectae TaxID=454601 RepID=A0A2R4MDL9_9HYPH|nr:chromate efflux transporter [Maritalea myrionectae]AVX03969.1 putative chromate transport protein [Maritalea myrionectae]